MRYSKYQNLKKKHMVPMTYNSSTIYRDTFPGCVHNFLVFFEAFWYNEMNKYGLPGPRKSRNHQNVKF